MKSITSLSCLLQVEQVEKSKEELETVNDSLRAQLEEYIDRVQVYSIYLHLVKCAVVLACHVALTRSTICSPRPSVCSETYSA